MSSPIEDFFRDPVLTIRFETADRVKELEVQVERLTAERDRLFYLYSTECDVCARAYDLLREHGIKWR